VTVHDLPPTAGYIAGEHVRLRQELGLLTTDVEQEWESHWRWLVAWENLLRERGLLTPSVGRATDFREEVVEALYRLIAQSPCRFLAVAVPDLVGDTRAQNQPGTFREYPNWQIPTCHADGRPLLIEDLQDDGSVASRCRRLFDAVRH
jgi:4-alpha-glucanotransferase